MFDLQSDSLVGVRVNSSSNVMLLIISNSAQSIADVNASAERALQHLVKLKPTDPVMVVEQHGFPQTFVPQEYPLGVVTNIVRDLGGMLMTKQKGDSVLGAVSAARTTGVGCVQHPELLSTPSRPKRTPRRSLVSRRGVPVSNHYTRSLSIRNRRGRSLKNDNVPLSNLLEGLSNGTKGANGAEGGLFQAKRRKERLKPFKFGPPELSELAVALRAYVTAKRDTSAPVTSWSNLLARKWPREYALSKQANGFKCTAQKVREAIDANLMNRYGDIWQWRGGWPAEAEKYPACAI